jgi:hypothetical protein
MASEKISLKLDAAVGRAIRDAKFRERMVTDARGALREEGLTDEELEQVSGGAARPAPSMQPSGDKFLQGLSGIFKEGGALPAPSLACWCTDKICYERG